MCVCVGGGGAHHVVFQNRKEEILDSGREGGREGGGGGGGRVGESNVVDEITVSLGNPPINISYIITPNDQ